MLSSITDILNILFGTIFFVLGIFLSTILFFKKLEIIMLIIFNFNRKQPPCYQLIIIKKNNYIQIYTCLHENIIFQYLRINDKLFFEL